MNCRNMANADTATLPNKIPLYNYSNDWYPIRSRNYIDHYLDVYSTSCYYKIFAMTRYIKVIKMSGNWVIICPINWMYYLINDFDCNSQVFECYWNEGYVFVNNLSQT